MVLGNHEGPWLPGTSGPQDIARGAGGAMWFTEFGASTMCSPALRTGGRPSPDCNSQPRQHLDGSLHSLTGIDGANQVALASTC